MVREWSLLAMEQCARAGPARKPIYMTVTERESGFKGMQRMVFMRQWRVK